MIPLHPGTRKLILVAAFLAVAPLSAETAPTTTTTTLSAAPKKGATKMEDKPTTIPATEEQWQSSLTPEQYRILRQKGTERAFTGPHWDSKKSGKYLCAGCNTTLFDSETKFDSGTGWPSYYKPAAQDAVEEIVDRSHGMVRTEVVCRVCKGHLGHVFPDGPAPTGLRYCINGHALKFEEAPKKDK